MLLLASAKGMYYETLWYETLDHMLSNRCVFSSLINAEEENIPLEYYEGCIAMNGSVLYKLVSQHPADTVTYYYIRLRSPECKYGLLLFSDISKVEDEYDIAEAMIYSFAY